MQIACDSLPNDVDALKSLLAQQVVCNEQLQADTRTILDKHAKLEARVLILQEQLNLALARRYAARSEKLSPDQIRLFDEAEAGAEPAAFDAEAAMAGQTGFAVSGHRRRQRGRQPLPETLPRVEVRHELPINERVCLHDGATLEEIGTVVSEQLDIVPAQIRMLRHIRQQYACACGQCI